MKLFTLTPSHIGTAIIHCVTCDKHAMYANAVSDGWKGYTHHPFTYACNICIAENKLHTCDACDKADKL